MEITIDWLTSLLLIIGIDLSLAGDNAIVIGMAAKRLPDHQQRKAILIGTLGAVMIRAAACLIVVWLIQVPWLHLVSGLLLIWMSYQFLTGNDKQNEIKAGKTFWSAIRTIIIADALMGLDNVLGIAGAASDHYVLIILGLIISVPLVMWGSSLIIRLMDRFPWLIYMGSSLLSLTAGKMILAEPIIGDWLPSPIYGWVFEVGLIVCVLGIGCLQSIKSRRIQQELHTSK